jgi:molecular chaperone GrpE
VSADGSNPVPPAAGEPPVSFVDRRRWALGEHDGGEAEVALRKPSYVELLEQQLAEKDVQLGEVIAKYKAAAREFDDTRVRARRDVAKEVERGKRAIMTELLDVLDNLERAIEAANRAPDARALLQGVEMVRDQFLARLEGFGITRIAALGEPFDPSAHEAATTVPTSDPARQDLVLGVIRPGYRVGDEILRPAVVAVGVAAEPDQGSEA